MIFYILLLIPHIFLENTGRYKKKREIEEEETNPEEKEEVELTRFKNRSWKALRKKSKKDKTINIDAEVGEREREIQGVLFLQFTKLSELAKQVREKLETFKCISSIRLKVVEKTGETIEDILHKSNP